MDKMPLFTAQYQSSIKSTAVPSEPQGRKLVHTFLKINHMKTISQFLIALLVLPIASTAQKTMTAEAVRATINSNAPLALTGVQITGDLDLTKLENMKLEPNEKDASGKTYISTVNSPVSFTNCTFTGKVLGYFNPDNGNITHNSSTVYNTNFTGPVSFDNCTFEKEVAFKYSEFGNKASFAGSKFNDVTVFKYAKFNQGPNFSSAQFSDIAVFKYVEFPAGFDFSSATFQKEADFKYAKFTKGGSFANTSFRNGSDFKYANFARSVNLKGASFEGSSDFKYTQLDNRKTTLSELMGK